MRSGLKLSVAAATLAVLYAAAPARPGTSFSADGR